MSENLYMAQLLTQGMTCGMGFAYLMLSGCWPQPTKYTEPEVL
jgi:hypothetical protein